MCTEVKAPVFTKGHSFDVKQWLLFSALSHFPAQKWEKGHCLFSSVNMKHVAKRLEMN